MTSTVTRRAKASVDDVKLLLTEFRGHRQMLTDVTGRLDGVKRNLMGLLERSGKPDEKGSLWIEFDEPVAGYSAIKRERRVKVLLDEEKAARILQRAGVYQECVEVDVTIDASKMDVVLDALRAAGLYDEVITVTERLSDDRIMQTYFAEKDKDAPALTADDIDAMFREDVSWAFICREAK